jgi:hypothetical protein
MLYGCSQEHIIIVGEYYDFVFLRQSLKKLIKARTALQNHAFAEDEISLKQSSA